MIVTSNLSLVTQVETLLDSMLLQQIRDISTALIDKLSSPLIPSLMASYFAVHGWKMWFGLSKTDPQALAVLGLKVIVFYTLALNVDDFGWDIADKVYQIPDHLVKIVNATGSVGGTVDGKTIDYLLDISFTIFMKLSALASANSSFGVPNIFVTIFAWGVLILGFIFSVIAFAMMFAAKFLLSVLLAIASIFLLMAFFDYSRGFFLSWVAYCVNALLISLLSAVTIKLAYGLLTAAITNAPDTIDMSDYMAAFIAVPFVYVLCALFLKNIPLMAGNLSGSRELSVGNASAALRNSANSAARGIKSASKSGYSYLQSKRNNTITGA